MELMGSGISSHFPDKISTKSQSILVSELVLQGTPMLLSGVQGLGSLSSVWDQYFQLVQKTDQKLRKNSIKSPQSYSVFEHLFGFEEAERFVKEN